MPLVERKSEAIATGPEVVEIINAELTKKGIPKMRFYEACKITPGAYSQWKTGLTSPKLETLDRVATFLNIPLADLICGPTSTKNLTPETEDEVQDSKEEFIQLYQAASPKLKEAILALLRLAE